MTVTSRAFDLTHGYAAIRKAAMSGIRKELAAGVNTNDDGFRGEADKPLESSECPE
jgi:hypothetical protein